MSMIKYEKKEKLSMSKCLKIGQCMINCWTKKEFDRLPLAISTNINCPKQLQKKYYGIFNPDNMSALNNYAQKENVDIYFSELEHDLFNNSAITVFKHRTYSDTSPYRAPLNLNIDTRENFVKSIREIYKASENAVKSFAIKKTDK